MQNSCFCDLNDKVDQSFNKQGLQILAGRRQPFNQLELQNIIYYILQNKCEKITQAKQIVNNLTKLSDAQGSSLDTPQSKEAIAFLEKIIVDLVSCVTREQPIKAEIKKGNQCLLRRLIIEVLINMGDDPTLKKEIEMLGREPPCPEIVPRELAKTMVTIGAAVGETTFLEISKNDGHALEHFAGPNTLLEMAYVQSLLDAFDNFGNCIHETLQEKSVGEAITATFSKDTVKGLTGAMATTVMSFIEATFDSPKVLEATIQNFQKQISDLLDNVESEKSASLNSTMKKVIDECEQLKKIIVGIISNQEASPRIVPGKTTEVSATQPSTLPSKSEKTYIETILRTYIDDTLPLLKNWLKNDLDEQYTHLKYITGPSFTGVIDLYPWAVGEYRTEFNKLISKIKEKEPDCVGWLNDFWSQGLTKKKEMEELVTRFVKDNSTSYPVSFAWLSGSSSEKQKESIKTLVGNTFTGICDLASNGTLEQVHEFQKIVDHIRKIDKTNSLWLWTWLRVAVDYKKEIECLVVNYIAKNKKTYPLLHDWNLGDSSMKFKEEIREKIGCIYSGICDLYKWATKQQQAEMHLLISQLSVTNPPVAQWLKMYWNLEFEDIAKEQPSNVPQSQSLSNRDISEAALKTIINVFDNFIACIDMISPEVQQPKAKPNVESVFQAATLLTTTSQNIINSLLEDKKNTITPEVKNCIAKSVEKATATFMNIFGAIKQKNHENVANAAKLILDGTTIFRNRTLWQLQRLIDCKIFDDSEADAIRSTSLEFKAGIHMLRKKEKVNKNAVTALDMMMSRQLNQNQKAAPCNPPVLK